MQEQNKAIVQRGSNELKVLTRVGSVDIYNISKHAGTYDYFSDIWGYILDIPFQVEMLIHLPDKNESEFKCSPKKQCILRKQSVTTAFRKFREDHNVAMCANKNHASGVRYLYHIEDTAIFIKEFMRKFFEQKIKELTTVSIVDIDDEDIDEKITL